MATYYVSVQRGNDGNGGTSQASPWLTIAHALATVAAGDTVYVGSGVYREQLTVSTAGTVFSTIRIIADPSSAHLTSDRPGRIHLTRYDVSWLPQAGPVLHFNDKGYVEFSNFTIDGSTGAAVYGGATGLATEVLRNCSIQSAGTGCEGVMTLYDCFVSGGQYGTDSASTTRCVVSGGTSACLDGSHNSTVAIAGTTGFSGTSCVAYNCTVIGGYGGVDSGTYINCTVHNAYYGFYGDATTLLLTNCTAIQCQYGFYGTALTPNYLGIATCTGVMCNNIQRGSGYESGTVAAAGGVGYDWLEARRVLEPWYTYNSGIRNSGTATGAPLFDVLNRTRPLGDGTPDRGAWEYSDYDVSYTAGEYAVAPPAWKCHRANQNVFYVPVEKDKTVTATCQVKHSGTLANLLPRILLRGTGIVTAGAAHNGAAGTWQELSVTSQLTTEDMLMEFVLEARDTTTGAWAYFSDFRIQIDPSSSSPIEYGSASLSSTADVTKCIGTEIPGGGGGTSGYYGNPYLSMYSSNMNWLDNNSVYFGITFVAPKTGSINRVLTSWKISSGYGAGNYGRYTVAIYAADSNGYPTGAALGTTTNWGPPSEGTSPITISASLTAGNRYAITFRNTYSPAASNWASPNTGQTYVGGAGVLPGTWDSFLTNSGYFGGNMVTRAMYSADGSTWYPWCSNKNPFSGQANEVNASISPVQLRYTADSTIYGHGYYSGSFSSGVAVYGSQRFSQYIPSWPWDTITATSLHVPVFTWSEPDPPAGNLNYAIETGGGTVLASGILCVPFTQTTPLWADMAPHTWKSASLSTSVTFTAGQAYRIILSSPNSNSANNYRQCASYNDNVADWNSVNFAGTTTGCLQYTTGTSWSVADYYSDMTFLLQAS